MKQLIIILFACISLTIFGQKNYNFTIDLTSVDHDQINVTLIPPKMKSKEVVYFMPKIVPGTYAENNFGKFIEDFEALDKKGKLLDVQRLDDNSWRINKAKNLAKIVYKVNDTFDEEGEGKKVFEPTGSNIEKDSNYLINTHCFAGYFEGKKQVPYVFNVLHSPDFYGSTPMTDADKSDISDKFLTKNYNDLVDNPIMYSRPDTATVLVGKSSVLISVYSPNKILSAKYLSTKLDALLQAQGAYLGGELPVKKYAFLVYLNDKPGVSGLQGALEHSYSSVYYMPEGNDDRTIQFLMDVSAHEFFHILTPLNIHSEEIQYFDFNEPKMSKHLWLYEGTTEYHAHLAQEKYGLTTKDDFLRKMQQKITNSRNRYNDSLSFTKMSADCLKTYADQYGNVYEKGALIAMCLDLKLRKLSNGKMGVLDLVKKLSNHFGKEHPFKDEELFDEIGKLTYPEIKSFLQTYVAGNKPLPLVEILTEAGVNFEAVKISKDSVFTLGSIGFQPNAENGSIIINNVDHMNEFGKAMDYHQGDEIISLNEELVSSNNLGLLISNLYKNATIGDIMSMKVWREREGGTKEEVTLSAPMIKIPVKTFNALTFMENPTADQLKLRSEWLEANG